MQLIIAVMIASLRFISLRSLIAFKLFSSWRKLKEQEMPVKNLIQMGNLAKSLHDLGLDPRIILGTKAAQSQLVQPPNQPTGQPQTGMPQGINVPSIRGTMQQPAEEAMFRPETAEMTPLGGLRPTGYKRVPTEAEKREQLAMKEAEAKISAKTEVFKLGEKGRANLVGQ